MTCRIEAHTGRKYDIGVSNIVVKNVASIHGKAAVLLQPHSVLNGRVLVDIAKAEGSSWTIFIKEGFVKSYLSHGDTNIPETEFNTFEYTLKAMLGKLPRDNEGKESCTAQYFELVSKLIEEYFLRVKENKINKDILDATKFFADVIDRIKSHQSREVRNSNKQDETLIGYLKIAHMVLDRGGIGE